MVAADEIKKGLLPVKSADRYAKSWEQYLAWKEKRSIPADDHSENVLLVYFSELSRNYKGSSLWSISSAIKKHIEVMDNCTK